MGIRLGSVATGDDFFDRTLERKRFWDSIHDNHINLSGPRRLGKTSLLKKLAEEAPQHNYKVCYADVGSAATVQEFLSLLNKAVAKSPAEKMLASLEPVATVLKRISRVTGKAAGAEVAVDIQAPPSAAWRNSAEQIRQRLGSQRLIVMIDEFSVFLVEP